MNAIAQIAIEPIDTTIISNQIRIRIIAKDIDSNSFLLSSTVSSQTKLIDTIDRASKVLITFPDFDKDGYYDILAIRLGNVGQHFLYLFDPKLKEFKELENYESYPDAVQLKSNPKYYYSYQAGGCSDYNWDSHLFRLEDYKIVHLGHIYSQGCEYEGEDNSQIDNSQIIEVYKISDSIEHKELLVEKLPYIKYIPDFEDKWSFIEEYWNKNYKKFE